MSQIVKFIGTIEQHGADLFAIALEDIPLEKDFYAKGAKIPQDLLATHFNLTEGTEYHVEAATGAKNKLIVRSLKPVK